MLATNWNRLALLHPLLKIEVKLLKWQWAYAGNNMHVPCKVTTTVLISWRINQLENENYSTFQSHNFVLPIDYFLVNLFLPLKDSRLWNIFWNFFWNNLLRKSILIPRKRSRGELVAAVSNFCHYNMTS